MLTSLAIYHAFHYVASYTFSYRLVAWCLVALSAHIFVPDYVVKY